jgi:hypothetical protein
MFSQETPQRAVYSIRKPMDLQRLCVRSEVPSPHVFPTFDVAAPTDNKKQYGQCTYNVLLMRIRATICSGKTIMITYSVCLFVALGIQHATRLRSIIQYRYL